MLSSAATQTHIRVFRSSSYASSVYRARKPEKKAMYRYDGLYRVAAVFYKTGSSISNTRNTDDANSIHPVKNLQDHVTKGKQNDPDRIYLFCLERSSNNEKCKQFSNCLSNKDLRDEAIQAQTLSNKARIQQRQQKKQQQQHQLQQELQYVLENWQKHLLPKNSESCCGACSIPEKLTAGGKQKGKRSLNKTIFCSKSAVRSKKVRRIEHCMVTRAMQKQSSADNSQKLTVKTKRRGKRSLKQMNPSTKSAAPMKKLRQTEHCMVTRARQNLSSTDNSLTDDFGIGQREESSHHVFMEPNQLIITPMVPDGRKNNPESSSEEGSSNDDGAAATTATSTARATAVDTADIVPEKLTVNTKQRGKSSLDKTNPCTKSATQMVTRAGENLSSVDNSLTDDFGIGQSDSNQEESNDKVSSKQYPRSSHWVDCTKQTNCRDSWKGAYYKNHVSKAEMIQVLEERHPGKCSYDDNKVILRTFKTLFYMTDVQHAAVGSGSSIVKDRPDRLYLRSFPDEASFKKYFTERPELMVELLNQYIKRPHSLDNASKKIKSLHHHSEKTKQEITKESFFDSFEPEAFFVEITRTKLEKVVPSGWVIPIEILVQNVCDELQEDIKKQQKFVNKLKDAAQSGKKGAASALGTVEPCLQRMKNEVKGLQAIREKVLQVQRKQSEVEANKRDKACEVGFTSICSKTATVRVSYQ